MAVRWICTEKQCGRYSTYRSGRERSQLYGRAGIGQKQIAAVREDLEGHMVGLAEK